MSHEIWKYPTDFGKFKTTEIIDYYDRPLAFFAKDAVGTLYFGYLLDEDEEKSDTILFTPVSEKRSMELLAGKVSMREALFHSESGWGFEVYYPSKFSTKETTSKVRFSNTLTEEELPDADVFLKEVTE